MNTENSEANELNKFALNFSQRLAFRGSNKDVALQIYVFSTYRKAVQKQEAENNSSNVEL